MRFADHERSPATKPTSLSPGQVVKVHNQARLPDAARRLLRRIIAGYDPQRVIVHGSFARGDIHEGSDLDLILVKSTSERFIDRIGQVLAFGDGESGKNHRKAGKVWPTR